MTTKSNRHQSDSTALHEPPRKIELAPSKVTVTLSYPAGAYDLSAEYLRVFSPSAEVRGHGKGNETLQTGKKQVRIDGIEPVGNYGVKFVFSDGHDSGIYSWDYLVELCTRQKEYWQDYLSRLAEANGQR